MKRCVAVLLVIVACAACVKPASCLGGLVGDAQRYLQVAFRAKVRLYNGPQQTADIVYDMGNYCYRLSNVQGLVTVHYARSPLVEYALYPAQRTAFVSDYNSRAAWHALRALGEVQYLERYGAVPAGAGFYHPDFDRVNPPTPRMATLLRPGVRLAPVPSGMVAGRLCAVQTSAGSEIRVKLYEDQVTGLLLKRAFFKLAGDPPTATAIGGGYEVKEISFPAQVSATAWSVPAGTTIYAESVNRDFGGGVYAPPGTKIVYISAAEFAHRYWMAQQTEYKRNNR